MSMDCFIYEENRMSTASAVFAHRLREERRRLGLSQPELAERMTELLNGAIDASAISRIETHGSGRVIKLDEAVAAAAALDLPLAALLQASDVIDVEIGELERDLSLAEWRAANAAAEADEARRGAEGIKQRISELKAQRSG